MNTPVPLSKFKGWYKGPEKSLSHRESYVHAAAEIRGEDPLVMQDGFDFYVLAQSMWIPNSYDFLSFRNFFTHPQVNLIRWAIESRTNLLLRGVDGLDIPPLIASLRPANVVRTTGTWDGFMSTLNYSGRRKLNNDLNSYGVIHCKNFHQTDDFNRLLEYQENNLRVRQWSSMEPYALRKHSDIWARNIRAVCCHFPDVVDYCVAVDKNRPVAVNITVTLNKRRFFICTLWDMSVPNAGLCALTHAVRAAYEDSNVDLFDLMGGVKDYKDRYKPDPNWIECEFAIISGFKDPCIYPPYILDGRLYCVVPIRQVL